MNAVRKEYVPGYRRQNRNRKLQAAKANARSISQNQPVPDTPLTNKGVLSATVPPLKPEGFLTKVLEVTCKILPFTRK